MKRAMEVMVWFYENSTKFSSLVEDEERKNDAVESDEDSEGESEGERTTLKEEQTTFIKQLPAVTKRRPVFIESPAFVEERPMLPERAPQKARTPNFAGFDEMLEHDYPTELPLVEELLNVASQVKHLVLQ